MKINALVGVRLVPGRHDVLQYWDWWHRARPCLVAKRRNRAPCSRASVKAQAC